MVNIDIPLPDYADYDDDEYYESPVFIDDLRDLADLCDTDDLKDVPPVFQFYLYKCADVIERLTTRGRRY